MKTRLLAFPLSVAAVLTFDACQSIDLNSPRIRVCHDDTTLISGTLPGDTAFLIQHDDTTRCRKAA